MNEQNENEIVTTETKRNDIRTLTHFVEDLLSNGRTAIQIFTVARCTRWSAHRQQIAEEIKRLSKYLKKKYTEFDDSIIV